MRPYHYVGPPEIALSASSPDACTVDTAETLLIWLESPRTCTYVVTLAGQLRVAPRNSEHVACAGGMAVLAAGEITFAMPLAATQISNQSTGYCPEPECWPAVASALNAAGIPHPGGFTEALVFRRCAECGQINVVREENFVCAVCDAELPSGWNFA